MVGITRSEVILVMSRCCFVGFLAVFWVSFSDVWWWRGDVLMMSGWWLGVVSLMLQCCFFWFGDGVVNFWWWLLMNMLIGFLSKISNSNLNLCVHLWANQCSCGPYVDRWCFTIEKFMLSVLSPWCLGDVAMMFRWFSVLFRWCHGDVSVLFS